MFKSDQRVMTLGEVDELNAWLGLIRTSMRESYGESHPWLLELLKRIQSRLFDVGSLLAVPDLEFSIPLPSPVPEDIVEMEQTIDKILESMPPLRSFVLPGGTLVNSYLHLARTVCRRAERSVVSLRRSLSSLQQSEDLRHNSQQSDDIVLQYLNRLSDLLFALTRWELKQQNEAEFLWEPQRASDNCKPSGPRD